MLKENGFCTHPVYGKQLIQDTHCKASCGGCPIVVENATAASPPTGWVYAGCFSALKSKVTNSNLDPPVQNTPWMLGKPDSQQDLLFNSTYAEKWTQTHLPACFKKCDGIVSFRNYGCECGYHGTSPTQMYRARAQVPEEGCRSLCGTLSQLSYQTIPPLRMVQNGQAACGMPSLARVYAQGEWVTRVPPPAVNLTKIRELHGLCPPAMEVPDVCIGGELCSTKVNKEARSCCTIRAEDNDAKELCLRTLQGPKIRTHCWLRICHKDVTLVTPTQASELRTDNGKSLGSGWKLHLRMEKGTMCEYKADTNQHCQSFKNCEATVL